MSSNPATVLVLNPGSTSTQLAVFSREGELWREEVRHHPEELSQEVAKQMSLRWAAVEPHLERIPSNTLAAVAGRGGLLKPLPGGTYAINDAMIADLSSARYADHASNLGALLAREVAQRFDVPAYIVDPVTTDEFESEARISGVPEIARRCRSHALNIKAVARKAATQLDHLLTETRFVVTHMGGGISVAALRGGRIVDVNDALLGMGPFSPERAGALPLEGLLRLAFSGKYTLDSLIHKLSRESGLRGYLGTTDLEEVLRRIDAGDKLAAEVYQAMVYQIAKEIGAMATVLASHDTGLEGRVDAVILTGGMARSERFCSDIASKVNFIAPVITFAGSLELEALALGAWRIINGDEEVKEYG
ncbi:MAG: butyrate kinase [Fidelibacterota bacterium]|nr:MAG: butyrate kinase [Candidatus Neomarinimicrobiota bacterium]